MVEICQSSSVLIVKTFILLGHVSSLLCVYELGSVCSRTQLCHIGVFNDYIKQLHVSAFSGHLQVVLREQT